MPNIYGYINGYLERNEKTGESRFLLYSPAGLKYLCVGVSPSYPRFAPLSVSYDERAVASGEINFNAVSLADFDAELTSRYLVKNFVNIGEKVAKVIIAHRNDNLFSQLTSFDASMEIAKTIDKGSTAVKKCFDELYSQLSLDRLYEYVKSVGGDYPVAIRLFERFGASAIEKIKENPYAMLTFGGAPLAICERLAKEYKWEAYDERRVHAITYSLMIKNRENGNTRILLSELYRQLRNKELSAGGLYSTDAVFMTEELLSSAYYLEETDDETYVYLKKDYSFMTTIAEHISRINASKKTLDLSKCSIGDVERTLGFVYSDEQRNAFNLLKTTGIKVLNGDPGTGKTRFMQGLLAMYRTNFPYGEIILSAPTGNAAKRLRETTGYPAETCHRTIKLAPYSKDYMITETLTADLWIIDESSMLDEEIFSYMLACVKNGALVLLVGDKDQLPSVGAGNVLADLIASGVIETYSFTKLFRRDDKAEISANSKKIIAGKTDLTYGDSFVMKRFRNEEDLARAAAELTVKYLRAKFDVQVYTPSRKAKFATGCVSLNRRVQELMLDGGSNADNIIYGEYRFYVGDKVLFNRNDYEKGYYNGQEGVVTGIVKKGRGYYVTVLTDEKEITLAGSELEDLELDYVKTAHKSQGMECDTALIVCPQNPKSLMLRKLLYVEVTRAKRNVLILSEGNAFEVMISSYMERERNTGLRRALQNCYH